MFATENPFDIYTQECGMSFVIIFLVIWVSCILHCMNIFFVIFWNEMKSHDSSVGIALGYGLDDRGSRVRFPAGVGNFSLHHRVQNGSGARPASYPMGTRGSFSGGKAAGAWSWPLTSISCRGQRMSGAVPPLPQYAFMAWCSVKAQGQL
jgi:Na+-transporting methylmalonyl-CoA/oxaloacetate decarboxylase gamma subunit